LFRLVSIDMIAASQLHGKRGLQATQHGQIRNWLAVTTNRHPYLATYLMVIVVTAFGFAAGPIVQVANLDVLYLLAVFISALRWGRRASLFCAVTAAVTFDFAFIQPRFSFHVSDLPYVITLIGFVSVAILTSEVASRARDAMLAERARADAETARARAEAARAEFESMNRAKDALLDRIAHELRSPLTAILGRVQLLQKTTDDPKRTMPLAKLERSTHVLARLVGDLLDASRMHVGKLRVRIESVPPRLSVARAVEDLAFVAADKGVILDPQLEDVANIDGDPDRIEQIVTNLVSNAIKFTAPGGRVTVRLRQADAGVELMVADTGTGIPVDFLPRLFEPFSQGENGTKHDGLGLGLAIVKNLVDAHRGRIVARNAGTGNGSIFIVTFPVSSQEPAPRATPAGVDVRDAIS